MAARTPPHADRRALLACFFWAVSFIASKVALKSASPLTVVTLRLVISALCFAVWFSLRGWPRLALDRGPRPGRSCS